MVVNNIKCLGSITIFSVHLCFFPGMFVLVGLEMILCQYLT